MAHHMVNDYMAHGFCFLWEPRLVWLHVISDIFIGIAYFSIPAALFYFVYKRRDLPFLKMFILLGVVFFLCGTTHILAGYTVYVPKYWFEGIVKAITAVVSVVTAFLFIPLLPKAIALPSLTKALETIKALNTTLEKQVGELELFRNLLNQANDAIFVIDPETGLVWDVNAKVCSSLGYGREELLKMNIFDIQSQIPDSFSWKAHVNEVKNRGHMVLEGSNRRKDGTIFPVEVNVAYVSLEKRDYMVAVVRDITERNRKDEALRESEEKFRDLFNNAEVAMFRSKLDGSEALDMNRKFLDIVGSTREETQGKPSAILWADPKEREEMVRRLKADGSVSDFEFMMMHKQKGIRNCITTVRFFREEGILVGSIQDVTERRQAEEALKKSQQRYQGLFDSSLDGIYQVDADGVFILMNPAGAKMFGHESPDEIIGKNALEYWRDPNDRDALRAELKLKKTVSAYHIKAKKKTGEPIELETSSTIKEDKEGAFLGIQGILRDITDRKKAEKEIKERVQELEKFYEMAVGRELKMKELKQEKAKLMLELSKCRKD